MLSGIDVRTFRFEEPFYLWLLVVPGCLVVLWAWRMFRRRADVRRLVREQLVPVRERYSLFGEGLFWLCLIGAAALCVVALARPQARVTSLGRTGADLVVLLDGSASMFTQDVKPDRWQRSVQFLRTFAETLAWKNGDRAALALFAHVASPQVRLTKDPNALFFFLDQLGRRSPFRLEDDPTWDTNIGEGVLWGLQLIDRDERLFGKTKNPKAFVVISDGQAWSGDVADALRASSLRGVAVYVVGVGTGTGGVIPETPQPGAVPTAPIRAVLDRNSLRTIASTGAGEYFEIGRDPDREIAQRILAGVKRNAPVSQIDERDEELYWRLLFGAALALCLATFALNNSAKLWWQVVGILATLLAVAVTLA